MVVTLTRKPFQRDTLAAAMTLLSGYATEAGSALQVYPALPTSFHPPSAYPEGTREQRLYTGIYGRERVITVLIRVLWRVFAEGERGDAVWMKADFIDGFSDYLESRFHAAGDNTSMTLVSADDDPEFVLSDPKRGQITYFSTLIGLEAATQN